jgi:hypothetical protein
MILDKIARSYGKNGIEPCLELLEYATACDKFSAEIIDIESLQYEMCVYLDKTALRMQSLSLAIGRSKEPHMGDVFTESLNLAMSSIVSHPIFNGCDLYVGSEHNYHLITGSYIKPDVGIYHKGNLISAFECKSNLGYDRFSWESSFEKREKLYLDNKLKPGSVFLVVATDSNWGGFPESDPRTGKTWISFCNKGTWYGGKNNNLRLSESIKPKSLLTIMESLISIV